MASALCPGNVRASGLAALATATSPARLARIGVVGPPWNVGRPVRRDVVRPDEHAHRRQRVGARAPRERGARSLTKVTVMPMQSPPEPS